MDNKEIGKLGENFAADYLLANGYRIIERNFTCKAGEIDIIAYKGRSGKYGGSKDKAEL